MDAPTIQKIIDTTATTVVGDGQYFTRPVFNPPLPDEPRQEAIKVNTLTGFQDYCRSEGADVEDDTLLIHVSSPIRVHLYGAAHGVKLGRHHYCVAVHEEDKFPFETWLSHADFMVKLQTYFEDSASRRELLRIIGTVKDSNIRTSNDNGTSQIIQATTGVALREDVAIPNPVTMSPFRTFREIAQPSSPFVVRLQQGRNGLPEIALFEAGGNFWELDAIGRIKEFLTAADGTIPIIA